MTILPKMLANRHAMPDNNVTLPIEKVISLAEYEKIKLGKVPESMDDRWFIYFEDNQLYFYRSWSGICIFIAQLLKYDEEQYQISEIIINRAQEQFNMPDLAENKRLFLDLLASLQVNKS